MSPTFGRGDFMAEYFDELIFDGKTYADLLDTDSPAIIINATDIDAGTQFAFDQDQFDLLCSDLASFPMARAVAASSAVPLALAPFTLVNYPSQQCGYELPAWAATDAPNGEVSSRRYQEARRIRHYVQHDEMRFVHFVDGGLSDNLGLRALYDKATVRRRIRGASWSSPATRDSVAFCTSCQRPEGTQRRRRRRRSVLRDRFERSMGATNLTLDRYSFETVENFKRDLSVWMQELKSFRCATGSVRTSRGRCDDLKAYFVELSLAQHPDPAEREFLVSLPTSFRLDPQTVDRVVAAAKTILDESAAFRDFLQDLAALDAADSRPSF